MQGKGLSIIILAGFLFFCLFLLFGCKKESLFEPHKGTSGVVAGFMENLPLDEVYENTDFIVGVDVRNEGAEDVKNVKFNVEAERKLVRIVDGSPFEVSLKGKSRSSPIGESVFKTVAVKSEKIVASEEYDTKLRVNYCYPYKTVFSAPVCIDSDVAGRIPDKPALCGSKDFAFSGGQGAPVSVVGLSVQMVPYIDGVVPAFSFEVENSGRGHIISYEADSIKNACSSVGIPFDSLGVIELSEAHVGQVTMVCTKSKLRTPLKGDAETEYTSERAFVRCTGNTIIPYDKVPYISAVSLELKYGYQDSIEKEVKIIKESP